MTGRQDLFDESMRLGHSAAWDLEWDRSIEFYRKALAEFPEEPGALTSLGLALIETGRTDEALAVYQQASEISADDPIPTEKCAEIFESIGDINQAIEHRDAAADRYVRQRNADKAIENWIHSARLDPENLAVRSRLALTFERLNRKREAAYEYLAVASILQRNRKVERALEAAQMASRLQPTDPESRSALRALRQGASLPPAAPPRGKTGPLGISHFENILKTETPSPSEDGDESELDDPEEAARDLALTMLAGMLFDDSSDEGDEEEDAAGTAVDGMRARLGQLKQSIGRSKKYQILGKALDLQTRGNTRQAAKEFKKAIESGFDHPAAHYNLGLLLKELHDYDGAHQHLMVAIGHPELKLGANLALGRITRSQGNLSEAARYLLQALRIADTLSVDDSQSTQLNSLYDTIMATQTEGDQDALSSIVENTLNFLSGPDWLHRIKIAREQLESQATDTSIVPIADMLSVGRTDRVVHALERIDHLSGLGLHASAMEEAMLALEYAPSYLGLHLRMADILLQSDRREGGLTKLKAIAETHYVRGETIQATKIYSRMLRLSPVDIPARKNLIDLLAQQDRIEEALRQYVDLAEIYRQMAEIAAARKTLGDALQMAQLNNSNREWLVTILREIGEIDISRLDSKRALRAFEQICNLDPSDEDAQKHVIDLNIRLGNDQKASIALDHYLQYMVTAKRSEEILPTLETMAREYPGKQTIHAHLAEAYKAVGRKADAIAQYDALGEIQLDAGQVAEAANTIQTIIDLKPPGIDGYRELLKNIKAST
jgi:tetratricopeptide (TPR) repeat protein